MVGIQTQEIVRGHVSKIVQGQDCALADFALYTYIHLK